VGFLAAALAARAGGDEATWGDFDAAQSRADGRMNVALVGFTAGGALVAGGLARYGWVRHQARRATLTVVPGGLALGGTF
jgi:hypothetical protein